MNVYHVQFIPDVKHQDVVRNFGHGIPIWYEPRIANNEPVIRRNRPNVYRTCIPTYLLSQSVAKVKVTQC